MEQNNENYDRLLILALPHVEAGKVFNYECEYYFRNANVNKSLLNKKIYILSMSEERKAIIGYVYIDKIIKGTISEMFELVGYDEKKMDFISKIFVDNPNECYALHFNDPIEFDEYLYTADVIVPMKEKGLLRRDFIFKHFITHVSHGKERNLYNLLNDWDKEFSLDGNGISDNPELSKKKILKRVLK